MQKSSRDIAEGILFTDLYQLTMAQLYYRTGMHERPVQFEYFFRSYPDYDSHKAGYCINAGLEWLLNWMREADFSDAEIRHLRSQESSNGGAIFSEDFLEWLKNEGNFRSLKMRAIPEGRVVHPDVPIVIVQGPLAMAQMLESSLLNHLNYQTLIATKASRLREADAGGLMIEFGLRRAQGKGANAATRAALIGGADFSSNTGISYKLGYPPKGTHAHSMIQVFMAAGKSELDAFEAYARVYPDDCLLLVDTIDTLQSGVPNAIKVFEKLRRKGHQPAGIRLDSGDLAYLSIQAAKMLNHAGFDKAKILISNQLDEMVIWQIITQIRTEASRYGVAPERLIDRLAYGVGTRLVTSQGHSALDGVYKLTAVKTGSQWAPAIKLSETPAKILNPGFKNVWRFYDNRGNATADVLGLNDEGLDRLGQIRLHHPTEVDTCRILRGGEICEIEPLLVDILSDGKAAYELPGIEQIRQQRDRDIGRLDSGVKRLVNPHRYHVSLTEKLWKLKQELVKSYKS